jgi:hypothetical protein
LITNRLIPLFAALIFAYIAYRGYALAMTHDEAYSFLLEHQSLFRQSAGTANNHVLNTFFMFLEDRILGTNPVFLRLHSIFAYLLFAFFSFKILKTTTENRTVIACLWLICNLNPFLLDFFSLARGYGMAIAFSVASVAMLLENRWRTAFIFASFAVLSNYTFLHFFNAALVFYGIKMYDISTSKNDFKAFLNEILKDFKNWFFVPILYIIVFFAVDFIKKHGDLEYGGRYGMGVDTFKTLLDGFLYFKKSPIPTFLIGNFIFGICLFMQIYMVYYFYKTKKILPISLLFVLTMDSCLAVFYFFKTPLPIDRTALMFYLIGIASFAEILNTVLPQVWQPRLALPIAAVFCFHFATVANLDYCFLWRFNADATVVNAQCFAPNKHKNIGVMSCMDGSILNYYNIIENANYNRNLPLIPNMSIETPTDTLRNILKKYDMIWVRTEEQTILNQKGIVPAFSRTFPVSQTVVMSGF